MINLHWDLNEIISKKFEFSKNKTLRNLPITASTTLARVCSKFFSYVGFTIPSLKQERRKLMVKERNLTLRCLINEEVESKISFFHH